MIIENLRKITDDMYAAIKTLPGNEGEGESTQKTLRAIDYSLEYLFAHVQLLGDRDMDYLNNNSFEPLTPQQKEKFFTLAKEAEQKANDLRIKISETLKTAYVKINIDKKKCRNIIPSVG